MCRNIKVLFNFEPPATDDEIHSASLQFVRKVSGFVNPSEVNEAAFNHAVGEITVSVAKLMDHLKTNAEPKNREVEREKAKARSIKRFGSR